MLMNCSNEEKEHYRKHINENWKDTHPIMKNVSSYGKIRPKDGIEFCILY